MSSFGDAIGAVISASERQAERRRLVMEYWRKARSGEPLSSEEKSACRVAYAMGILPSVPNYDLYQWVEDNCPVVGP